MWIIWIFNLLKFSFKVLEPELKNQEVSATSGSCRNLSLERWHRKGGDTTEKGFLLQLDEGFGSDQEGWGRNPVQLHTRVSEAVCLAVSRRVRQCGLQWPGWGRNCPGAAVASRVHCTPTICTLVTARAQKVNKKKTSTEALHTNHLHTARAHKINWRSIHTSYVYIVGTQTVKKKKTS